jgi:hypothetical protein
MPLPKERRNATPHDLLVGLSFQIRVGEFRSQESVQIGGVELVHDFEAWARDRQNASFERRICTSELSRGSAP